MIPNEVLLELRAGLKRTEALHNEHSRLASTLFERAALGYLQVLARTLVAMARHARPAPRRNGDPDHHENA